MASAREFLLEKSSLVRSLNLDVNIAEKMAEQLHRVTSIRCISFKQARERVEAMPIQDCMDADYAFRAIAQDGSTPLFSRNA